MRAALTGRGVVVGTVSAAAFGVVTPFCSCSAVPLFIGFLQAGIPTGATLAFLISSPLVNEVALVLLLGLFGWEIAVIYLVAGLAIANETACRRLFDADDKAGPIWPQPDPRPV